VLCVPRLLLEPALGGENTRISMYHKDLPGNLGRPFLLECLRPVGLRRRSRPGLGPVRAPLPVVGVLDVVVVVGHRG
jgi:hypothetical protein